MAAIVVAACVAGVAVVSQAGDPDPGDELAIAGVRTFDPQGDNGTENDHLVTNAVDGDLDTAWTSESYTDPVALAEGKDGFGLIAGLDATSDVAQVSIDSPEGGWSARVYASDAAGADLEAWGEPLASVAGAGAGTTTFAVDAPGVDQVLVWFTQAAPSGVVSVSEMRISGT